MTGGNGDRSRATARNLSVSALSIAFLGCTLLYWCLDGLRYDDAFIFLRVAHNILDGHGPVWNAGDRYTNSTSALWPLLLAFGALFTGPAGLPLLSKTLSYACLSGASLMLYLLIRRSCLRNAAWIAPFAVFLPAHHFLLAGMESGLALFALLATAYFYSGGFSLYLVAIAAGVLYLARPDGALFILMLFLDYLFAGIGRARRQAMLSDRVVASLRPALVLLAICLAWHVYLYIETTTLLPATMHAKIVQGTSHTYWEPFSHEIGSSFMATIDRNAFMFGFASLGAIGLLRIAPLIAIWVVLHLLAYSLMGIAYYPWYFYPLYFAVCLCAFLGVAQFVALAFASVRQLSASVPLRLACDAAVLAGTIACLVAAIGTQTGIAPGDFAPWARALRPHGGDDLFVSRRDAYADSRREAHEQASQWILGNRPLTKGATILTDEIGLVGYRLNDWRVVDEVGMTDPAFDVSRIHNWRYYVSHENPMFIIRNYVHDQPDVISFQTDPTQCVVYEKMFRPTNGFIADVYERTLTYGAGQEFLAGASMIAQLKPGSADDGGPLTPGETDIYRLAAGKNIYAIVTTLNARPPASTADNFVEHVMANRQDLVPDAFRQFVATSKWTSGDAIRLVTIEALPPGHYDTIITRGGQSGGGQIGGGQGQLSAGSFDIGG